MTGNTTDLTQAKKVPTKVDILKNVINAPSIQEEFRKVWAENAGAFMASILELFMSDGSLQNCDPGKVVGEALKAASLKLLINKSLGFAYIIPYNESYQENGAWKKRLIPQFQLGYKGLIQLAMRTGQYKIINADKVYAGELQKVDKLTGTFDINGTKTSDEIVGYFAYIEMLNGFSKTLYMTKEQVITHAKKYSKSYTTKGGTWEKEPDAMSIKTVLRNLIARYGILSIDMQKAIAKDIEADSVEDITADIINTNANKTEMGFEDAQVINDNDKAKDDCPI